MQSHEHAFVWENDVALVMNMNMLRLNSMILMFRCNNMFV